MLEIIKKSLLTGLGIAVVTRDKLEKVMNRFVEEGKMSRDEAQKMIDDMVASGENQWRDIEGKIRQYVKDALDDLDLCRKKDCDDLQARVAKLEERLTSRDSEQGSPGGD